MSEAGKSNHHALLISIVLAIAIILRVYPTIFHGAPWGTDGWPLFKDAQLLLSNTPTTLGGNSRIFADQYNVYWSGSIVFGAASSLVFGSSSPVLVMSIFFPLVGALSSFFLFVVVEKITGNTVVAFISSLVFATSSFDSIFMASATKETFAYPLFMVGILLLLLSLRRKKEGDDGKFGYKLFSLFVIVSFSLELAHYALVAIFAAIVAAVLVGEFIVGLSKGHSAFDLRLVLLPISLLVMITLYFGYSEPSIGNLISASDLVTGLSFLILSISASLYFTFSRRLPLALPVLIFISGIAILIVSSLIPVVPFEPIIPPAVALDAIPYLLTGLFALVGFEVAHRFFDKDDYSFLSMWLAVPLAFFGYSIFGTANGVDLVYRLFTFIYAPVAVFAGIALGTLFRKSGVTNLVTGVRLRQIIVLLVISVIALLCVYQSYGAVVEGQNLLGGQWGYSHSDVSSGSWASVFRNPTINFAGDTKVLYLFQWYYGVGVNVGKGYEILAQGVTNQSTSPLVTDKIMRIDGYNLELYGNPLPTNWHSNLLGHSDLVYSNGNDEIWY